MIKTDFKQEIVPVAFLTIVVCISVISLYTTNGFTEELIETSKNDAVKSMLKEQLPVFSSVFAGFSPSR